MENTPGQRIKQWRELKGLTLAQVSKDTSIKVSTLSTSEQPGSSNPSFDTLNKLLGAYPDLSPDWLLTGSGPMLRGGGRALVPAPTPADPPPLQVVAEGAEVRYLKEKVKDQAYYIELLREQLERLSSYLPEQLGKLVPDSFAAEPRARVGFAPANVQMHCNGRAYSDARYEVRSIWHEESTMRAA